MLLLTELAQVHHSSSSSRFLITNVKHWSKPNKYEKIFLNRKKQIKLHETTRKQRTFEFARYFLPIWQIKLNEAKSNFNQLRCDISSSRSNALFSQFLRNLILEKIEFLYFLYSFLLLQAGIMQYFVIISILLLCNMKNLLNLSWIYGYKKI